MAKISINIATGSLQQEELIVGIDLGTTNSLIAIIHPDTKKPIALKDVDDKVLVPSVIHFDENGNIQVGTTAKDYLIEDASNTIYSVKRLLGKSYQDIVDKNAYFSYKIIDHDADSLVKIQIGEQFYSPIELSSFILKELKERAEHVLKQPISKCVITVPAFFNDAQRQATRDAGKLAGLEVLRIINEPTAASLAYGIGTSINDTKQIAVYDLGGGTFDISILRITEGIFDVLSTHGDTYLGGDDLDKEIVRWIQEKLALSDQQLYADKQGYAALRLEAENAKKQLSYDTEYTFKHSNQEFTLSRSEFEQRIQPIIQRTIQSCEQALRDSGLSKQQLQAVVLVGGSSRVPLVKKMVADFFEQTPYDNVNPDEVVALGAAVQADILAGNTKDILLLDITPLSLGIETMGGLMDVLIPRNTKIPAKAGRQYTTQKDGQSGIRISVYQGERDLVKDNRKLAEFILSGIPSMPAGLPKVDIQFILNADGILQVRARELRSGIEQTVDIKPQFGLTDAEVEQMLLDSIMHAKADIAERSVVEAITEAENLIQLTENFMHKHEAFIVPEERSAAMQAIAVLQEAMQQRDKNAIMHANEELNRISSPFAERVMDAAVAAALKGKTV
ncbi:MAG: Fe-S protein assembly chaperone HscA [Chitinophagaceae bacterium]|nr:Fe-S protein assembly chaperone HscA [Chitinophagaceae bacterium]